MGFRVDGIEAEEPPVAVGACAYAVISAHELVLVVVVSLVAVGVCVLRLDVHDFVYDWFGHDADELLDIGHPVLET